MDPDRTPADNAATLGGFEGSGYAVVESLASLGKGRRLTGIFCTSAELGERVRAAFAERRRLPFRGPVHFRHHSLPAELEVELASLQPEGDGVRIEFVAWDVPYGLG